MSNAPSKPVSFSRPKVGYFSNRPRIIYLQHAPLHVILHALRYIYNIYIFAVLFTVFPLLDLLHFVVVN